VETWTLSVSSSISIRSSTSVLRVGSAVRSYTTMLYSSSQRYSEIINKLGNTEDFREIVQDLLVSDLKPLWMRLDVLEREMSRHFEEAEHFAKIRQEEIVANLARNHASIIYSLEMEKRLARLEALQAEKIGKVEVR
jgi:hypothetical protein